jgi:hypothetical protein
MRMRIQLVNNDDDDDGGGTASDGCRASPRSSTGFGATVLGVRRLPSWFPRKGRSERRGLVLAQNSGAALSRELTFVVHGAAGAAGGGGAQGVENGRPGSGKDHAASSGILKTTMAATRTTTTVCFRRIC